jgi:thioredoxin
MAAIELTEDNFNDIVQNNAMVLVDFWADWCGPCKSFAPVFEAAAAKNPDIVFAKVDTQSQQALAGHFGIRSIPTLMIFRDQIIIFSQAGALPAAALDDIVGKAKALDMDIVRAEIAKQESNNA